MDQDLDTVRLIALGPPAPPETVILTVPVGVSVIVQTEEVDDPTIVMVRVHPSHMVVINGATARP